MAYTLTITDTRIGGHPAIRLTTDQPLARAGQQLQSAHHAIVMDTLQKQLEQLVQVTRGTSVLLDKQTITVIGLTTSHPAWTGIRDVFIKTICVYLSWKEDQLSVIG